MKRNSWLVASLSLCLLTYAASTARATGSIRTSWKNRYPTACSSLRSAADACTLCHTNGSNPTINNLNAYGQLAAANLGGSVNWANTESADSDADGRTNLQEILTDCTRPGDATSPTANRSWGAIKGTYR